MIDANQRLTYCTPNGKGPQCPPTYFQQIFQLGQIPHVRSLENFLDALLVPSLADADQPLRLPRPEDLVQVGSLRRCMPATTVI